MNKRTLDKIPVDGFEGQKGISPTQQDELFIETAIERFYGSFFMLTTFHTFDDINECLSMLVHSLMKMLS